MTGKGIIIAVSGKGGVGKTNLAALLVRCLAKIGSVLAIDADPDSNLPQALGAEVKSNVGEIREAIVNAPARSEVAADKGGAFERELHKIVEETPQCDIVMMGRSEGEGCYCAINHILRQIIDSRVNMYDFTVIDCEAGLEHLSRRTTKDVDVMLVVTDATKNGILTAKRIEQLSKELYVDFGEVLTVGNRVTPETKELLEEMARENGVKIMAYVPYDPQIAALDIRGRPALELAADSPAAVAVDGICQQILEVAGAVGV